MSLEDSMKELADSNRELAAAMKGYTKAITENARLVVTNGGATDAATDAAPDKAPAPAKGKGKGKGKTETPPPADDDDGFGESAASTVPDKITADMMKAKLIEVKEAHGDKEPALAIIREFGYNGIPEVKPADFKAIWIKCEESLAEANG